MEQHNKSLLSDIKGLDRYIGSDLSDLKDTLTFSDEQDEALSLMGLDETELIDDYTHWAYDNGRTFSPADFQSFVDAKVLAQYETLREDYAYVSAAMALEKAEQKSHSEHDLSYVTRGHPPDHITKLPLQGPHKNGLNSEGLLKGMHALTSDKNDAFDLYTKNCSKTCISV